MPDAPPPPRRPTTLSAPLPVERAAPSLAPYRDTLAGVVKLGNEWYVIWQGEIRARAHPGRLGALEELWAFAREVAP